jgi:NADPH2:quinone reductase
VLPFPRITPHSDGSGVIDAVGEGVNATRLGERVWLWNAAWGRADGTAAEWVVLPQAMAVPLPAAVPLEVGALLGIPALTACHAVLRGEGVRDRRVLVAGGAGAVGHYAVQLARLAGARQVIASVSSQEKGEIALEAGADAVVNYRDGDLAGRVRALTQDEGVDRIIEVDFAANAEADFAMLAANGEIVVYGSGQPLVQVPFVPAILKNVGVHFFIVYHLPQADRDRATGALTQWLQQGALRHRIALQVPLERIAQAHAAVESGSLIGNALVDLRGDDAGALA